MRFDVASQADALTALRVFKDEYDHLPRTAGGAPPRAFHLNNGMFGSIDAELLYAMVRLHKPARIIEIGAGWTTALIAQASARNEKAAEIKTIDPNPPGNAYDRPNVTIFPRHLQEVGDVFGDLEAGDMVIVDGSHKYVTDGEIDLVLRALPGLSGVYVMFHDIFLPEGYPEQWFGRGYNEQEHLEEYLDAHPEDEIVIGANFLHKEAPDQLAAAIKSYDPDRPIGPGALWFMTSLKGGDEAAKTVTPAKPAAKPRTRKRKTS